MDNNEKARKICDEIIRLDYNGSANEFAKEFGSYAKAHEQIFFWLEDGHGDGMSIDECRLLYEIE